LYCRVFVKVHRPLAGHLLRCATISSLFGNRLHCCATNGGGHRSRQADRGTGAQIDSPPLPEPIFTEVEACEFLRIRPRQLYPWRNEGLNPFTRIGRPVRHRRRGLEAALDAMSVGGFALEPSAPVTEPPEALCDLRA
jgi:hypothetical protein